MALGRYYDKEFERSGLDDKIKENKLSNAELSQSDKEKLFYLNEFVMVYRNLKKQERFVKSQLNQIEKMSESERKERFKIIAENRLIEIATKKFEGKQGDEILERIRTYDLRSVFDELEKEGDLQEAG